MIWEYKPNLTQVGLDIVDPQGDPQVLRQYLSKCAFCDASLRILLEDAEHPTEQFSIYRFVRTCDSCGWWTVERRGVNVVDDGRYTKMFANIGYAWGELRHLDLSDLSIPITELRHYLLKKYSERFNLNPRRFEEIVGDVFSDFGYTVRVTSFSGDDGIDVVALDGEEGNIVGIQVKRYQAKIEPEQIRAFAGALVLNGMTRGIFVTTSSFTGGAQQTSRRFQKLGLRIELSDANDFYDRLQLKTLSPYDYSNLSEAPFASLLDKTCVLPRTLLDKSFI
jgi:restriction system protein